MDALQTSSACAQANNTFHCLTLIAADKWLQRTKRDVPVFSMLTKASFRFSEIPVTLLGGFCVNVGPALRIQYEQKLVVMSDMFRWLACRSRSAGGEGIA